MDGRTETNQMSDTRTLVVQTLQNGFSLLRFPDELEQRFSLDVADRRLRLLRWCAVGAMCASIGILLPDYFMVPDVLDWALILRMAFFVPACALAIWWAPHMSDPDLREWGVAACGVVALLICLALILMSKSDWAAPYLVILNIVVIYTVTVGRFWPSTVVCMVAALIHFQAMFMVHGPWSAVTVPSCLLLGSSIGYSLYCNYRLEHRERLSYLLGMQEQALQDDLKAANDALARTARTDALTEVANRRHFDEFLSQVWHEASDTGASVALMLLDIDHFKAYNDRYGHQAGDRCLCTVALAIGACLRKSGDLVARWGGEEFAVVMTGTTLEVAKLAAERVRQAVMDTGLVHVGSTSASVVTVSIGVSAMTPTGETLLVDFVRDVDVALYQAKARGRNQVVSRGEGAVER